MNFLRHRLIRLPMIALGAVAWLAVSNHCAVAALENAKAPTCHECAPTQEKPAKQDSQNSGECCKVLRATFIAPAKSLVAYDGFAFAVQNYFVADAPVTDRLQPGDALAWNTGPPGADSFAVAVLQRSLLAHAPPFALS